MALAEILTPDGDGDEEGGIQQLEDYVISSGRSNLRPQSRVLFADPHYRPYQPESGDDITEQRRKEQTHRRNADSPMMHHMSGMATSVALSFGMPRHWKQQLAAAQHRGTRPVIPGGGGPQPRKLTRDEQPTAIEEPEVDAEGARETKIAESAMAHGHLIVSHSTQPPSDANTGPEIYHG